MTTKRFKKIQIVRLSTGESRIVLKEVKMNYLNQLSRKETVALGFWIGLCIVVWILVFVKGISG